ncbi:hypothetical protein OH492_14150 [Vibrio chagasii]|nr:hypothetical protein [Vibrio chagasii]
MLRNGRILAPKCILNGKMLTKTHKICLWLKSAGRLWTESIDFLLNLIAEGDDLPLNRGTDYTFITPCFSWYSGFTSVSRLQVFQAASELAG